MWSVPQKWNVSPQLTQGFFKLRFTNLNQLLVDGVVVSNQPPIRSSWSLLFAHGSNHTMTFAAAISFGLCGSDVGIPFGNEFAFGQVDMLLVVSFGFFKEDWLTHRRGELTDFRRHVPRCSKVFPWCSSILPLYHTSPFQLPSFSTKSSGVKGWSDPPLPPVCRENLFPVSITAVVKNCHCWDWGNCWDLQQWEKSRGCDKLDQVGTFF